MVAVGCNCPTFEPPLFLLFLLSFFSRLQHFLDFPFKKENVEGEGEGEGEGRGYAVLLYCPHAPKSRFSITRDKSRLGILALL